jgi:hypothetical protein
MLGTVTTPGASLSLVPILLLFARSKNSLTDSVGTFSTYVTKTIPMKVQKEPSGSNNVDLFSVLTWQKVGKGAAPPVHSQPTGA